MTVVLSLIVLLVIFVSLFLLLLVDKDNRTKQLRRCADQLALNYRPFAALSSEMRDAHFYIIEIGQFRNFRHLIEGKLTSNNQQLPVNLFDYSLVSNDGTANQTLVLIHCPLPCSKLRIQQKSWLQGDAFTGPEIDTLTRLQTGQLHPEISNWQVFSERPAETNRLLTPHVRQWLLAHPHLHIEWSNGILLLYRPKHLLDEQAIAAALEAAGELVQLLQNSTQFYSAPPRNT